MKAFKKLATSGSRWPILLILISIISCKSKEQIIYTNSQPMTEFRTSIVIEGELNVQEVINFDKDVIIYPGAFIKTSGKGVVNFKKYVTVIGETQIFDTNSDIKFADNSLTIVNPSWWGARGDDNVDDTEIIQKVFDITAKSEYTQTIQIPLGNFLLSKKISFNRASNTGHKLLIIKGTGPSASASHGSSFTWQGAVDDVMLELKNIHKSSIQDITFKTFNDRWVKYNISLKPFISSLMIDNCTFSGVAGQGSSNISLNKGNGDQVSEVTIQNCHFRGVKSTNKLSDSAISGGISNCKNFYFQKNSFGGYKGTAINIHSSDMFVVENNTFFENGLDIQLADGNARIESNYSEASDGFYSAGFSSATHQSYLVSNYFASNPKDQLAIKDGSGELIMINNNFGGNTDINDKNILKIRWEVGELGSITSIGNFFKGTSKQISPFIDRSGRPINAKNHEKISSKSDLGGTSGSGKIRMD